MTRTAVAAAPSKDTAKVAGASSAASDTSLSGLMNNTPDAKGGTASTTDTAAANHPLMALLSAQPDKNSYDPAAVAYIHKNDLAKLAEYLGYDEVKNVMPTTAKLLVGAEKGENKFKANAVLPVYAVRHSLMVALSWKAIRSATLIRNMTMASLL